MKRPGAGSSDSDKQKQRQRILFNLQSPQSQPSSSNDSSGSGPRTGVARDRDLYLCLCLCSCRDCKCNWITALSTLLASLLCQLLVPSSLNHRAKIMIDVIASEPNVVLLRFSFKFDRQQPCTVSPVLPLPLHRHCYLLLFPRFSFYPGIQQPLTIIH